MGLDEADRIIREAATTLLNLHVIPEHKEDELRHALEATKEF